MNTGNNNPELDMLDQLQGGRLRLDIIRKIYPDTASFIQGVYGALRGGDVRILENDAEVPAWRQRELFERGDVQNHLEILALELTNQGQKRIG